MVSELAKAISRARSLNSFGSNCSVKPRQTVLRLQSLKLNAISVTSGA